MNEPIRVLLSFVGYRDPYAADSAEPGPLLSLLAARSFDRVVLFCTGSDFVERARAVAAVLAQRPAAPQFDFINLELRSPIDYEEIFVALQQATESYCNHLKEVAKGAIKLSILLDPGTPQMQTSWFLLVRSAAIDATLLQGIPARFSAGVYSVKEVRLTDTRLPKLRLAERSATDESVATGGPAATDERSDPTAAATRPAMLTTPRVEGARPKSVSIWLNTGRLQVVGNSPRFVQSLEAAAKVARYEVAVLIRGETGSGKGIVARLIHENSRRRQAAFLPLNCSAITASLAESELFGHAKGSFTGATANRLGAFRAAEGGTIFLDEVGDLPIEIQPKLLRVLEDKMVIPVGEDRPVNVDVRVIAATNKDLQAMINNGSFRRDLYERLAQVTLELPPLRERPEDIELLLQRFIENWNSRYHECKRLADDVVAALTRYPWPGNVRELENCVLSMCASAAGPPDGPDDAVPAADAAPAGDATVPAADAAPVADATPTAPTAHQAGCPEQVIGIEAVPPAIAAYLESAAEVDHDRSAAAPSTALPAEGIDVRKLLHEIERGYYLQALERAGGNAERAAELLGISGHAFRKALRERFDIK